MALLTEATNTQTVTVATEIALVTVSNPDSVPTQAGVLILASVAAAAGTGGTTAAIKCRQGTGTGGTQVGPTVNSPVATAGLAAELAYNFFDPSPAAGANNGIYTITLTFTGNSSSVVNSTAIQLVDTGFLND